EYCPKSHPRQWVDASLSTYKGSGPCLHLFLTLSRATRSRVAREREGSFVLRPCRLHLNDPPTAVGAIRARESGNAHLCSIGSPHHPISPDFSREQKQAHRQKQTDHDPRRRSWQHHPARQAGRVRVSKETVFDCLHYHVQIEQAPPPGSKDPIHHKSNCA